MERINEQMKNLLVMLLIAICMVFAFSIIAMADDSEDETPENTTVEYEWKTHNDKDYTGLAQEKDGTWYYVVNGEPDLSFTDLVQYYSSWYYVENGKLDWTYTGLFKFYSTTYYINKGKLDWNYRGLYYDQGTWYYVNGGRIDTSYTNLVPYGGRWFYVINGKIDWTVTTLAQVNGTGTWYYVKNGELDWNYSGLYQFYSTWYYIQNGRLNWGYNNLVYYSGSWFYVHNGRIEWNYTNLVKYNGKWYYVKNGKIDWSVRTLAQVNGKGIWYYVNNAQIDWNYTGFYKFYSTEYFIHNGVLNWTEDTVVKYAKSIFDKVTNSSMTKEQKLRACFNYVADPANFTGKGKRIPYYKGNDWPIVYANDMRTDGGSTCHGFSALFGYLAGMCGYNNVHWCEHDWHAWVDIDGRIYDPIFWKVSNYKTEVYGITYATGQAWDLGAGYRNLSGEAGTWMYIKVPQF